MGNKSRLLVVAVCGFFAQLGIAGAGPASEVSDREIAACPKGTVEGPDGVCAVEKTGRMGFDLAPPEDNIAYQQPAPASVRGISRSEHGESLSLRVEFAAGSVELSDRDKAHARSLAALLLEPQNGPVRILLAGNSDSSGRADTNMELSKRRAEAVKDYLVSQGVDEARVDAVGYGSTKLARRVVVARRID